MNVPVLPRRRLGRTSLHVTEFGLGTAALARSDDGPARDAAAATLEAAWDGGIRYFDTAPRYGAGLAERLLGDFLRGRPRDDVVISSKVGRLLSPDRSPRSAGDPPRPLPFVETYDYTHDGVLRSFEDSLTRLGLDRIDVLTVHDIGTMQHGAEHPRHLADLFGGGFAALRRLRDDGAIGAVGLGVNEVAVCLEVLEREPLDCIVLAGRLTVLDRTAEARLVPACERSGTSLVAAGVLNSGVLLPDGPALFDYAPAPPEVRERAARMHAVAAAHGASLVDVATSFPLTRPGVASVLLGTADPGALDRALAARAARPDAASLDVLDEHALRE